VSSCRRKGRPAIQQQNIVSLLLDPRQYQLKYLFKGIVTERKDLELTHEEADVIIPRQVVHAATQGSTCIKVINDDTDVFTVSSVLPENVH